MIYNMCEPSCLQDLLEYITLRRKHKVKDSLIDLIMQYCHMMNYDPEEVGDIIRDDYYFSEMIHDDCVKNQVIVERNKGRTRLEDW